MDHNFTAESLPIEPKTWKQDKCVDKTPVLTLTIRRPSFSKKGTAARVERYFDHLSEQWKQRWETILFPKACSAFAHAKENGSTFSSWTAALDYTITYWEPPILSVQLATTENGRTPQALHIQQGETWNLNTGFPCSLRSFFPAHAKHWRRELLHTLKEQAETQLQSGESLLDPNCTQIMERSFDPERFYLIENKIALFFPLYLLGPYAEGIPTFYIPRPER